MEFTVHEFTHQNFVDCPMNQFWNGNITKSLQLRCSASSCEAHPKCAGKAFYEHRTKEKYVTIVAKALNFLIDIESLATV